MGRRSRFLLLVIGRVVLGEGFDFCNCRVRFDLGVRYGMDWLSLCIYPWIKAFPFYAAHCRPFFPRRHALRPGDLEIALALSYAV